MTIIAQGPQNSSLTFYHFLPLSTTICHLLEIC